jgi:hypothetical protein
MTKTLFTLGSGRSGSFLIHRLLSLYPQVESYHEYCCPHVQQVAVLHYLGLYSEAVAASKLEETHGAGVRYCEAEWFADSSNKLSFLIQPTRRLFPDAKFLWLVRDGRRVVSSYFHKLPDEVYVDKWVEVLYRWLDRYPANKLTRLLSDMSHWWTFTPPPTKAIWWPVTRPSSPVAHAFRYEWNRWQRLCWYWNEVNTVIKDSLSKLPEEQWRRVRLEELTKYEEIYDYLANWLGMVSTWEGYQLLKRPTNVTEPVNYALTPEQEAQYWEICGETHLGLGYGREAVYDVRY